MPRNAWEHFGDRKRQPSGECIVYLAKRSERVVKVRNPFAKSAIKLIVVG